ncbi:MAG: peptide ABC transporter substrate-binding protein [Thermomicrobiales bacterium]
MSRRDVLRRSLALGLSAPLVAGLLAACGDDDDDDDAAGDGTTAPGGVVDETPTEGDGAGAGDEPTSTESEDGVGEDGTPTEADAGGEEGTPTEAGSDEPAGERGGGGKITLLYWQAPTILNPHFSQGTKDDHASRVTGEPLFDWDENTEPVLVLAEEWPTIENGLLAEDGTSVTWRLRQGVLWHDGEEFTADDVRFTWEFATNPDTTATTSETYDTIESIDVVDDYTVTLNFRESNPAWFDPFSGVGGIILPEHILGGQEGENARDAEFNLNPVYTGPYRVTDFRPGDTVLYELFEDYWDDGYPYYDTVEMKGGGDATSAARAVMVTGEADWAWNLQVEPEILNQMEDEGGEGQLVTFGGTSAERIMVNFANPNEEIDGAVSEPETQHPIWQHREARMALSLAIQRQLIADQLYGPGNEATGDVLNVPPPFKVGASWEYDLEAAREQLNAINFPDDFDDTSLLYQTSVNSVRQKNQEVVKDDLEQLGFTVELKSVDSGVFFSSDAGNPDTYAHFYADIEMYTNGPGSPYPIAWAERYRSDSIAQQENNWSGTNITRYDNLILMSFTIRLRLRSTSRSRSICGPR